VISIIPPASRYLYLIRARRPTVRGAISANEGEGLRSLQKDSVITTRVCGPSVPLRRGWRELTRSSVKRRRTPRNRFHSRRDSRRACSIPLLHFRILRSETISEALIAPPLPPPPSLPPAGVSLSVLVWARTCAESGANRHLDHFPLTIAISARASSITLYNSLIIIAPSSPKRDREGEKEGEMSQWELMNMNNARSRSRRSTSKVSTYPSHFLPSPYCRGKWIMSSIGRPIIPAFPRTRRERSGRGFPRERRSFPKQPRSARALIPLAAFPTPSPPLVPSTPLTPPSGPTVAA